MEDNKSIFELIEGKSVLKQDVFDVTKSVFTNLKLVMKEVVELLEKRFGEEDKRLNFYYKDRGDFIVEIGFAGDVMMVYMHTNVFKFEKEHPLWNTSYLKEDSKRAYCGTINFYNFLADSVRYKRSNDLGYLIGRLYVNSEKHYFVQGRKRVGVKFTDFMHKEINTMVLKDLLEEIMKYIIDFDLYNPPYSHVGEVSLAEIQEISNSSHLATGKRLGYQFTAEKK